MQSDLSIKPDKKVILYFSILLIGSILLSVFLDEEYILALPLFVALAATTLSNYKLIFFALIAAIPISTHKFLGSLALELFSEPLMIFLTALFPFIFILRYKEFDFIKHPIVLLIIVQLVWTIFVSFFSVDPVVSVKYIVAKIWFIIPFVFLAGLFLKKPEDLKKLFWLFHIPLAGACLWICYRHSLRSFSFEAANFVINPFYINHVMYSTTIAAFVPFVWYARYWYKPWSIRRIVINLSLLLFLFSIGVSYTRASWIAVGLLIPAYYFIKYKLTKPGLLVAGVLIIAGVVYINYQNKYLDFAVEYKKVIYHHGDLEKHLQATYEMQDVSGMERLYRWMAALKMIEDNIVTGTGPNTFHPEYKRYAINLFSTYVSENPERSTTHNYFLMIFSEQGLIGFAIFIALFSYLLIKGTTLIGSFKSNFRNHLTAATTLSLIMIFIHLFLNDLIETDKIGSFFYLCCTFMILLDNWKKEEEKALPQETTQDR